jgi:TRAP-type transport system periplasmic protein
MRLMRRRMGALVAAGALLFPLIAAPHAAHAAGNKTYVMKLGLATINDSQHEWCKRFVAMVEKDSGGRIQGQIFPASQLGSIQREIEGVQFGEIQGYIGPPEFLSGVDQRFEITSAPGLITDIPHAVRVATDPEMQKLMFSFGADKGIHSVALFIAQPSAVIARDPIRHLADFKGKKLRVLAAAMEQKMMDRLGATPVAMTLADVLPAIQQGTIDGALAAMTVYTTMHYWDASKYVTETGQPFIFSMAFLSKKWFDALPRDLQTIVDADAEKAAAEMNPWEEAFYAKQREIWAQHGELISLPAAEQGAMMNLLSGVGDDVTKGDPGLHEAYRVFVDAVNRTK